MITDMHKEYGHFLGNLGKYHDLYVQSDFAQLADILEQFRTLCLKEYELDPYFSTTPGLAMEACLKNLMLN